MLHETLCIVCSVDTSLGEVIEFFCRLIIKVLSIHDKYDLINLWHPREYLARLERSESFSASCRMPYIPVFIRFFYSVDDLLSRIVLIRSEDHQFLICLTEYDISRDHLRYMTRFEKYLRELFEVRDIIILIIRPEKSLFE